MISVQSSRESAGNYGYDLYRLPLDKEGLAMVRSLAAHGGMVFAYNDKKGFRGAAGETSHLSAFFELMPDWYANYTLWDENAARWGHPDSRPEIVKLLSPDPAIDADGDF